MPELPEVEQVVKSLKGKIKDKIITNIEVSNRVIQSKFEGKEAIVKGMSVDDFRSKVKSLQILGLRRRGKYLVFELSDGHSKSYISSHLGMSGAFFVVKSTSEIPDKNYQKHCHIRFHLDSDEMLIYSDIRRFGELRYLTEEEFAEFTPFQKMAPEPFEEEAKIHFLLQAKDERKKKKAIKDFMMGSNENLTGSGNIYSTEALFATEIRPNRLVKDIPEEVLELLFDNVVHFLRLGLETGGASISDYVDADGKRGSFQEHLQIYGKTECFKCGSTVEKVVIAGRSSSFCPTCQT